MKYDILGPVKRKVFLYLFYQSKYLMLNILLVTFFLFFTLFPFDAVGQSFRAAAIKVDITPKGSEYLEGFGPRKSTGVHDHIFHRIVVLDDGSTRFILISSDLCLLSPSICDRVADVISRKLGANPDNIWWTVTHDHSAPQVGPPGLFGVALPNRFHHGYDTSYTRKVEQKLIEGAIEACKKLIPARLGVGWGFSQANINRRAFSLNGKKAFLGMNPTGAVDQRIGLIKIDKEDGSPIALIANYPIHGTVLGPRNLNVSGDVAGIVSEYVENKIGAPLLFINGAAGNVAPIDRGNANPNSWHLNQYRHLLGDKIIKAYRKISYTTDSVRLFIGKLTIETPRKTGYGWPKSLKNYSRTTKSGIKMIRLPIRFLKINNNVAIWSAPVELYCEIAMKIRMSSPFGYTFYFGYCNGWLGYFPTSEAFKKGGYTVNSVCPFTPSAEKDLTEWVLSYLGGELRSN